ncbi:glycoside hydrolase family 3 C-terminal domain-containing protein [Herbiconiux ginsengi]|uniref:Beta-glucosidase n=1 Tax=Herbiconiux ginsengi TaxID=381665 RepID=A0A1H3TBD7_9MICO|nr:glycoside hydrolase family 3 C-terminal domain-containing protein [Herbiconiux ginsengi]SDZ47556.1 beta-glucosidase [Herbiconiux ginsengi]
MTDTFEIEAADLVARLSLAEKATLGGGASFWESAPAQGVPTFVMSDGPHGLRRQEGDAADHLGLGASVPATCFPPAVGLGQSWDHDLVRRVGGALALEAQDQGVNVLLGPGINIKRDPRCGRNFEYLSEDPYLTSFLASSWVNGLQAGGVGASLKHFAANNAEYDRMRLSSDVADRPLREIYLRAFERVIRDAQPWTVMCSYNRINGVLASQNKWLLTDVLRRDWGFKGAVVSDWGAVEDRVAAVAAGLDLQMPGGTEFFNGAVVDAVLEGELSETDVDRAATAVARTSLLAQHHGRDVSVDYEAHHALAREAAVRSIVLLKNDGNLLPLEPHGRIAVIGAFASAPRYQGGGSSHVRATHLDIPLSEIRTAAPRATVEYALGFTTDGSGDAAALRLEAAQRAHDSDIAIVFLGLAEAHESEGFDRETIDLPPEQLAVLEAVAAEQPNTVVVLSAGGIVHLAPVHQLAPAILSGGLLGQGGGAAIADVLFGAVNPSGRLAETVPLRLQDAPSYLQFPGEHSRVVYGEGLFVGYRGYDARAQDVLYPFGHGLSYTDFSFDALAVEGDQDGIAIAVSVQNLGPVAGREIVQIYASKVDSAVSRAPRELVGVSVVEVEPGDSVTVHIRVDRRDLAYWDDRFNRWIVEDGVYRVAAAKSSRDIQLESLVEVVGDVDRSVFTPNSTVAELMSNPAASPIAMAAFGGLMPSADAGAELGMDVMKMVASMPLNRLITGTPEAEGQLGALLEAVNSAATAPSADNN